MLKCPLKLKQESWLYTANSWSVNEYETSVDVCAKSRWSVSWREETNAVEVDIHYIFFSFFFWFPVLFNSKNLLSIIHLSNSWSRSPAPGHALPANGRPVRVQSLLPIGWVVIGCVWDREVEGGRRERGWGGQAGGRDLQTERSIFSPRERARDNHR